MINWKELGMSALIGGIYGGAAVLVTIQKLDVALLVAVVIGIMRGAALAVVGLKEPKETATCKIFSTKYSIWKRIL